MSLKRENSQCVGLFISLRASSDAEGGPGAGQCWQSVNKLRISPETKLSI